jgi:hypothetical protein
LFPGQRFDIQDPLAKPTNNNFRNSCKTLVEKYLALPLIAGSVVVSRLFPELQFDIQTPLPSLPKTPFKFNENTIREIITVCSSTTNYW